MYARLSGRIDLQLTLIAVVYFVSMMGMGIVTPYMNLHFARIGLSGSVIGLITAALPLGGIFGPPLIATWADAKGRIGPVIATTMLLAGIVFAGVISVQKPALIIALTFVYGMLIRSVTPLMDAATLQMVTTKRGSFGRLRAWGSLGFMSAALVGGMAATALGVKPMLVAAVGLMIMSGWFGRFFPTVGQRVPTSRNIFSGLRGLSGGALSPNFRRFAAILLLGQVAEATQNTFFAIHMDRLGIAESMTGVAWTFAVTSEVLLLWNMDRLLDRYGVRTVVTAGFVAAALRWGLTAYVTEPLILLAVQALHGLTFGAVYAGTVKFVHLEVPAGSQASGQALITGARAAFAGVIGTTTVGYLSDVWSIPTLYAASSAVAFLAALLMLIVVKEPTHRAGAPADDKTEAPSPRATA